MWGWLEKRARERRAKNFLRLYPRDEPVVQSLLIILASRRAESARDAAEIANGRKLAEAEWLSYANRWERAWRAIAVPKGRAHR